MVNDRFGLAPESADADPLMQVVGNIGDNGRIGEAAIFVGGILGANIPGSPTILLQGGSICCTGAPGVLEKKKRFKFASAASSSLRRSFSDL